MASFFDSSRFRPEVRQRLAPYRAQIEAAAQQHGVPADLAFGTIASESSGKADAGGDNGVARGLWQVQTPFLKDWLGAGPDVRHDPVQSSQRIMPAFRANLDASDGDWGLATVRYMQGPHSDAFKRIKAGEDPARVLAKLGWVLARYNSMRELQGKRGAMTAATGQQAAKAKPTGAQAVGVTTEAPVVIPALGITPTYAPIDPLFGVVRGTDASWVPSSPEQLLGVDSMG
ncbi:MAG TPA: transglycosylase SLT domain-containing protein [Phycisphaerae bacterium]|nr:transglycosylase SLT domain-containing protein [Phycisphaerae bacterium]